LCSCGVCVRLMDRQRGKQTVLSLLVYMKAREGERKRACVYRDLRHTTFCTTSEKNKDFTYTEKEKEKEATKTSERERERERERGKERGIQVL
jgi:hypothetical protein